MCALPYFALKLCEREKKNVSATFFSEVWRFFLFVSSICKWVFFFVLEKKDITKLKHNFFWVNFMKSRLDVRAIEQAPAQPSVCSLGREGFFFIIKNFVTPHFLCRFFFSPSFDISKRLLLKKLVFFCYNYIYFNYFWKQSGFGIFFIKNDFFFWKGN